MKSKKTKNSTYKMKEGGGIEFGDIDPSLYNMAGDLGAMGIDALVGDKTMHGGAQMDGVGKGIGKGALSGAGKGAAIGSIFGPVGAAIGGGAGAIIGGIAGGVGANKAQNNYKDFLADMEGNTNINPQGTVLMQDGGLAVVNPLINIEAGELLVDKNTGDIIEEYSKERGFKPHSKKNEDSRNFVQAQENGVVIPKRMAEQYKSNPTMRVGYIRDVLNKQADRMMYGVDSDGNKVEYSQIQKDFEKMKDGGFSTKYGIYKDGGTMKYHTGGYPIEPPFNPNDPLSVDRFTDGIFDPRTIQSSSYIGSTAPKDNMMGDLNSITNLKNTNNNPYTNYSEGIKVNTELGVDPISSMNSPAKPKVTKEPIDLWTTGNTIGAIGTGISALGPLAMTLANGLDRNERNYFDNVSQRAEGEVGDIFRGVENRGMRDINMGANKAYNLNRNRSTNFSGMLANAQNIARGTQRSMGDFLTQISNQRAQLMSNLMLQGDMASAQGATARDERLDQNRDNYYSNLAANLSNAGVNMQGFGKNLNQNTTNQAQMNILKQISPYFDIDEQGNMTYKGKKLDA